jgi:glc operon protein GlcG
MRRTLPLLALLAAATAAHAAEPLPTRPTLTLAAARRVADAAEQAARGHGGGVIAVVDDGGNVVYLVRLDGAFPAGADVSVGKARTAALFRKPSGAFEEIVKNGRTAMLAAPHLVPLVGGVPLVVGGQVVGGIGVAGAASPQDDESIATAGARALD